MATGKAMVAFKSAQWLGAAGRLLTRTTQRTIMAPDGFAVKMCKIRMCGYAVNRGEWHLGVNRLA